MEREIKFRAWDKLEKRMGEVNYIKYSKVWYTHISVRFKQKEKTVDEWFNYWNEDRCNNIILMQYTGLKDKNGVEIYEGDIVRIDETEDIDVVDWTDGKEYGIGFGLFSCFKYEVIGNIYANPELLKEGEKIERN